ncbi:MAG: SdpI family protein [Peptococcaceae bacterium]|nr:SdpI family protein [Peptococcaceae bacterium]
MAEVRRDWLAVLLIITSLITGVLVYPHLPDLVPSHWNVQGQVDRYSSRLWGAFGLPLMTAGIYLLMVLVPRIDPRRENYARFRGAYRLFKLALTAFFVWVYAIILTNAMGRGIPVDRAVVTAMGLLFMVMGNYMGQLRYNYFVGIKTPWTLASEEVWQKTHRFSARLWVVSGLAVAISGLLLGGQKALVIIVAALGAAVVVPLVHSYVLFRKTRWRKL